MKKLILALLMTGAVANSAVAMQKQQIPLQVLLQQQPKTCEQQLNSWSFGDVVKSIAGGFGGYLAGAGLAKIGALLWAHPVLAAVGAGTAGIIALSKWIKSKPADNVTDLARLMDKYKNDPVALRIILRFIKEKEAEQKGSEKERAKELRHEIERNKILREMMDEAIEKKVSERLKERPLSDEESYLEPYDYADEHLEREDTVEIQPRPRNRRRIARRQRRRVK